MCQRDRVIRMLVLAALLAPLAAPAAPLFTITVLPEHFFATDINNAGQIVGSIVTDRQHAALLDHGRLTTLSAFDDIYSYARAINETGIVAGMSVSEQDGPRAFTYDRGHIADLGAGTVASSINAGGDVVGYKSTATGYTGFIYRNGSLTALGNLADGNIGAAWDINDAGTIVGESNRSTAQAAPVLPTLYRDGDPHELDTLFDGRFNGAQAINNAGLVAGYGSTTGGIMHAFVYQQGVLSDAGTFGGNEFEVRDINAYGIFTGWSTSSSIPGTVGYLYHDGRIVDLNALLDTAGEWAIDGASGINDLGQVVASGCRAGGTMCRSLRLDPVHAVPEPGTALLLMFGLLLTCIRKNVAAVALQVRSNCAAISCNKLQLRFFP